MSYILDALRRADSERERGAIPGIHAQPVPAGSADGEAHRAAQPAVWVGVGLLLALLGVWAWNGLGSEAPAELAQPEPAAPAPIAAAPTPAAVTPAPAPAAIEAAPTQPERPPAAARRTAAAAPAAAARPATAKPAAPVAEASAERRVYALDQLPADIRGALPALALGGSIYSESPTSRFLIVNGQTFRENDKIAADLTLERIQRNAAVFEFKGYRYSLPY